MVNCAGVVSVLVWHCVLLPVPPAMPIDWNALSALARALLAPRIMESFPVMEELHQKYGAKGLVILAVNVDEKAAAMTDFLKEHPVKFAILHDATKKLVGAAKIASMPTSFVIGKDGVVVSLHKGFHGKESATQYVAEVEKLLAGNVASK